MNFKIRTDDGDSWLELYNDNKLVIREELSVDAKQQKQDMLTRLHQIVNHDQKRFKHKLVSDHDLTRWIS